MKTRTKQLAILLAVGVVLSSGAYALGSQAGGGGALASSSAGSASGSAAAKRTNAAAAGGPATVRGLRRGARDFGLDALATKLGVTPAALQTALQAIRDE